MRFVRTLAVASVLLCACASQPSGSGSEAGPVGYQGGLAVSPDPVAFEDTRIGCTRTLALQVRNVAGEGPITLSAIESPDRAFRPIASLPLSIPPGEGRAVDLHFVPRVPGPTSTTLTLRTGEPGGEPLVVAASAIGLEPLSGDDEAAAAPIDLVLVLDVSTSMTGMAAPHPAIEAAFDEIDRAGLDARLGLVTFVDDVRLHGDGAFMARDVLLQELDRELDETGEPDPESPRQVLNFDYEENVLDALQAAATRYPWRPDARRVVVLVTDSTFLESPAVLSGTVPVRATFADVVRALGVAGVRLVSVNHAALGAGLSSSRREEPGLVARTGGSWFELADVVAGAPTFETVLLDALHGRDCD